MLGDFMKKKLGLPASVIASVRVDTSIADCVRLLRDRSIGALLVTSANAREDLVGVFTERDLVKNIELIHRGGFWENPVRTVMTTTLRTVSIDKIEDAPRLMARYNIRHMPVMGLGKDAKRVIGVLSMRDLFRVAMEQVDYNVDRLLNPPSPVAAVAAKTKTKAKRKLVGVFSSDKNIRELIDQSARMSQHLIVKAQSLADDFEGIEEVLNRFEVLVVDLDSMPAITLSKFLARAKSLTGTPPVYVLFSPLLISDDTKMVIHKLADSRRIHLIAKPVALGLLYEKLLKRI